MIDFDYQAPQTVDEAVKLLAGSNGNTALLAGGTDILVQLREGHRHADLVVDVKKIPELLALDHKPGAGLTIGAATPCWRVYGSATIADEYPGLCDCTHLIGAWQIQSRASVGGNLCNASPAADTIPMLIAYDAICHVAGGGGTRTIPVAEFCVAPGKNSLRPGEFLVRLEFPAQPASSGAAYLRFIPRNEMDIAVVGVGCRVVLNSAGDTIESARIGLGAVAPTPVVAQEAGDWLAGKPTTAETFAQAGELAKKVAKPISDMRAPAEYRTHLVGVLTKRALATAVERAGGPAASSNGRKS